MDGDTNQLRDQMASGTAVNCVQLGTGNTALFLAVLHDKLEAASFLLDAGAEFKLDNLGRTPLYVASSALAVDLLVAAGASVNAQDKDDNTPLHTTKVAEVAQALLAAGADASLRNQHGCTALEVALAMGSGGALGWIGVRKPQAYQREPFQTCRRQPHQLHQQRRDAVPRPEALARMSRAELECRIVATRQALTALEGMRGMRGDPDDVSFVSKRYRSTLAPICMIPEGYGSRRAQRL
ncbi:hypothetical protein EMIHUDRAFT_249404 [Emiliania huxleyi CCMP1516]|uniref:Uncharacterized protein n=2 Tax=Emiliania huxleyi TaxID=2903 RepID=A0A0D3I967_EMIH1|nr:hypothetical protein EMIHUDRAFT_249404 [Emiliania huxleyi CCMP1516]EOD07802.1 hypothetical protein EMIHUDRAFT_249404 [Emiliania huxleyi CCMP1516]|eukprot:XP_005760231.1 hypothetical protein EMIHUDRAFT_249404 [Emiliania huxleyi CCMP1516]